MHVYRSHLEARNACPIHFTLPAAQSSSYDICILCSTRYYNCPPISEMAADLRHLLSGKAGGLKKKKCVIVRPLCVIASKTTWGVVLCVYCFCPVRVIPPHPHPPCVCLQPTAAMLIIWRLRWASLTPWWRPSAGCCCSLWARRAMLHRGHGILKRVCGTKLTSYST